VDIEVAYLKGTLVPKWAALVCTCILWLPQRSP